MKWRKKVILAKIETEYGSDPTPTGAANAILARDINLTPLAADTVERDNPRPELGAYQRIHVGEHVMLAFDVEVAGAGAAGSVPAYDVLKRACGLAFANNAGVSQVYTPRSDNEESITLYLHFDGQLHKLVGARGTWGLRINRQGIAYYHFEFTALFTAPASATDATPDFSNFVAPKPVSNGNTPTATLHGQALVMSSLEISSNNQVQHRDLVGVEEVAILSRAVSGRVRFEAPALSTFNWFTTARANTLAAFQLVHGTTAGNIVQIDAPQVQITNPTYAEEDALVMIDAELVFVPNTGDDEITLTVK